LKKVYMHSRTFWSKKFNLNLSLFPIPPKTLIKTKLNSSPDDCQITQNVTILILHDHRLKLDSVIMHACIKLTSFPAFSVRYLWFISLLISFYLDCTLISCSVTLSLSIHYIRVLLFLHLVRNVCFWKSGLQGDVNSVLIVQHYMCVAGIIYKEMRNPVQDIIM
jgi:hypothetical protein